ncbi:MAG: hypothetical protein KatS3mg030_399 [Saprospiraceae bacterium]|nr:MAG: hypothetical protein KatS3mg030_399 [Saprospiraceae bacterium]
MFQNFFYLALHPAQELMSETSLTPLGFIQGDGKFTPRHFIYEIVGKAAFWRRGKSRTHSSMSGG